MSQYELTLYTKDAEGCSLFALDTERCYNFERAERRAKAWSRQFPTLLVKLLETCKPPEVKEPPRVVWFQYGRRAKAPLA